MLRALTAAAFGTVLLLPLLTTSTPADAQERVYRFCHVVYEGIGRYSHQYCTYTSFEKCMATRSGIGGQCQENPEWIVLQQQRQQSGQKRSRQRVQ